VGEETTVEPQEHIAQLKQDLADARAEITSLKKALDKRESDNKEARDRIKTLEAERANIEALLPGDDTTVLAAEDAKAWAAYQELGKPDQVKVKLDDYDRATREAAQLRRRDMVDRVSRDPSDETRYRFKPTVLERLLADATLSVSDKGEATVKVGDAEKPLEKWLEEDQADFLPALQAQAVGTPAVRQPGDRRTTPTVTPEQLAERKRSTGEYNL